MPTTVYTVTNSKIEALTFKKLKAGDAFLFQDSIYLKISNNIALSFGESTLVDFAPTRECILIENLEVSIPNTTEA